MSQESKHVLAVIVLAIFAFIPQAKDTFAQVVPVVVCPAGYTCTPVQPQPVSCPVGYICNVTNPSTGGGGASGGGSSGTNACFNFSNYMSAENNVRKASTGIDVKNLQIFLNSKGFRTPVTSVFDAQTEASVKLWQASVDLPNTGFVGPLSIAKFENSCNTIVGTYLKTISSTGQAQNYLELTIRNQSGTIVPLDTFNFPKLAIGTYSAVLKNKLENRNMTVRLTVSSTGYTITDVKENGVAVNDKYTISIEGKYVKTTEETTDGHIGTYLTEFVTEQNEANILPLPEVGIGPYLNSNPGNYLMKVFERKDGGVLTSEGVFKIKVNDDRAGFTVSEYGTSTNSTITIAQPSIGSVFDNGPTQNINIQWNSQNVVADYYSVNLSNTYTTPGSTGISIGADKVSMLSNGATFQPTDQIINGVVANSPGKTREQIKDSYYVFVTANKDMGNGFSSEVARGKSGVFTITTPSPNLFPTVNFSVYPNTVKVGEPATISWSASSNASSCVGKGFRTNNLTSGSQKVIFYNPATLDFSITCTTGSSIEKTVTQTARLVVVAADATSTSSITVTSPNGGERLIPGSIYPIRWSTRGTITSAINIAMFNVGLNGERYGGSNITDIDNVGSYNWTVPRGNTTSDSYWKLLISSGNIQDESDNYFTIISSTVTPPPTIFISTNPSKIAEDSPFTLSWSSTNSTSCYLSSVSKGLDSKNGSIGISGSFTNLSIESNARATITCNGAGGTRSQNIEIELDGGATSAVWNAIKVLLSR